MDYKNKIEELVSNRMKFDEVIYTSLDDAINELDTRWSNKELDKRLEHYIGESLPETLKKGFCAVLFRQITTPNYETRRFMCIPDATKLKPVFWEYENDKFTSNNLLKYYFGKLGFHVGIGSNGQHRRIDINTINFNESNGKPLKNVVTLWGESLINFHKGLMKRAFPNSENFSYDASEWFLKKGGNAKDYYKPFISLFVKHAILFENFALDGTELQFIKDVFLPAFFEVWENTGVKPLIVALSPTEIEGDIFWVCHPLDTKKYVEEKISNIRT